MTTSIRSERGDGIREFIEPIAGTTRGRLVFERGTPDLRITVGTRPEELAHASFRGALPELRSSDGTIIVHYPGFGPVGWLLRSWRARAEISLNTTVPWTLDLRGGVHGLHADLRSSILEGVAIRGGIAGAELWLPSPRGTLPVELAGGVNSVSIHRPRGIPVRLSIRGGISSLSFDAEEFGSIGRGMHRETPGWSEATDRVEVSVTGGVNHLEITS